MKLTDTNPTTVSGQPRVPTDAPASCCPPLLAGYLSAEDATQLAQLFRVLGEPARLQILNLIAAQASEEVCACELVEALGLAQPTVSHHLKVMYKAGLLSRDRRGTWIYYRIVPERIAALRKALK
ncbi:ArsR/SmtB family transcription factor [Vacuolonema iberomarrocanum]|uniref:ArsR/SmtB family transcription factor n=1 Tax=Vacuolonema iberomarrocanum TaxID=3454632 RepID=UPI0019E9D90A|nr:helix-turn-helix transcriptional regulator [filamentous cyanobacterium LEGE 07170]